jgi:hypothetical protein
MQKGLAISLFILIEMIDGRNKIDLERKNKEKTILYTRYLQIKYFNDTSKYKPLKLVI